MASREVPRPTPRDGASWRPGRSPLRVRRHLLLLGGGHSHLHVLRMAAMQPIRGARITLVSPDSYTVYSGMVPGTLGGLYEPDAARIDLRALAARAGIRFIVDRAVGLDPEQRRVRFAEVPALHYDVLSIDVGSRPRQVPAGANVLPLKPVDEALARLVAFSQEARTGRIAGRVVVVGAGAGGVEVAFAIRARLRGVAGAGVTVVDRVATPLPQYPPRVSRKIEGLFVDHGIRFIGSAHVAEIGADSVRLSNGERLEADLVVWASGAEALPLSGESGLAVDGRGFLLVADTLQSVADPAIFAAGDCASLVPYPDLPKAGVFAVRQGPILWHNLRVVITGEGALQAYRPQRDFLSLLSTGDGRAVLSYYGLVAYGGWVWRLKDWIDRRFVDKHAPPGSGAIGVDAGDGVSARRATPTRTGAMGGEMAPCGGCAAKVSGDVLARVLARLDLPTDPRVVVGLQAPDDAAVTVHPAGAHVVSSVDFFPPFLDDPYVVGGVAAVNAASDLYAMGADPVAAMALVALPEAGDAETEETLELLLRGAWRQLRDLDIALVGGHTIEGKELLFGFSVTGAGAPGTLMCKAGARPGDRLVLTKALGTGVVLAATRAGTAPAAWADVAIRSMLRPNRAAAAAMRRAGVRSCTDVTGFGVAGHLLEMLRASRVAARLDLSALPALPGALELLATGMRSSFHERNATNRRALRAEGAVGDASRLELLFDPQTSGGLLAAVPAEAVDGLRADLRAGGDEGCVIGEVVAGPDAVIEVIAGQLQGVP